MIDPDKPVALRRAPEFTGRVHGDILNDRAYVRWDQGGGHTVPVDALIQEGTDMTEFCDKPSPHPAHGDCEGVPFPPEDQAQPKAADKSWPPADLETKVPEVDRK